MVGINRWLTVAEVAKKLGVSKNEVYRMVREGELPAKKISGHRTRISDAEVERFMDGREDAAVAS